MGLVRNYAACSRVFESHYIRRMNGSLEELWRDSRAADSRTGESFNVKSAIPRDAY